MQEKQMPPHEEVEDAVEDVSDMVTRLGFELDHVDEPNDEQQDNENYYIYANKSGEHFYIILTTAYEFGEVVYAFNIAASIGNLLSEEEIDKLVDDDVEYPRERAGEVLIEQTPIARILRAKFSISAYSSNSLVNYSENTAENGFPIKYECRRGIFPYTDGFSIRKLDDRIESTITAGKRGARYVNNGLFIDKNNKEDPTEFELYTAL
jgi:hypothetical protein